MKQDQPTLSARSTGKLEMYRPRRRVNVEMIYVEMVVRLVVSEKRGERGSSAKNMPAKVEESSARGVSAPSVPCF